MLFFGTINNCEESIVQKNGKAVTQDMLLNFPFLEVIALPDTTDVVRYATLVSSRAIDTRL